MSGSLKPYFYFIFWTGAAANGLQEPVKAFRIIWDGEHIRKDFTFRTEDEAVMLVFGNINTNANHDEYLRYVYLMLGPQDALLL